MANRLFEEITEPQEPKLEAAIRDLHERYANSSMLPKEFYNGVAKIAREKVVDEVLEVYEQYLEYGHSLNSKGEVITFRKAIEKLKGGES